MSFGFVEVSKRLITLGHPLSQVHYGAILLSLFFSTFSSTSVLIFPLSSPSFCKIVYPAFKVEITAVVIT